MIISNKDRVSISPYRTFTFTPGRINESVLAPITLPTAEPATAHITYTIEEADFFTSDPMVPMLHFPAVVASGKMGALSGTITHRLFKNGVATSSMTSGTIAANSYWTQTYCNFSTSVVPGDVIEVKLWSTRTDVVFDFQGMFVNYSQPEVLTKRGLIVCDLSYDFVGSVLPFTSVTTPTLSVANTPSNFVYPSESSTNALTLSSTSSYIALRPHEAWGFWRANHGDASNFYYANASTTTRGIQKQNHLTRVSFREIQL
jgi:hypothetical protein